MFFTEAVALIASMVVTPLESHTEMLHFYIRNMSDQKGLYTNHHQT